MHTVSFEQALGLFGRGLDAIRALPPMTNGAGKTSGRAARTSSASTETSTPVVQRKKPGPKPKAVKAEAATKAKPEKKKPGPKPKAAKAKAAKAAKTGKGGTIAEGRRAVASGSRPRLVDSIGIVMGSEEMTASQILEALVGRGWKPGAAQPQAYLSFTLSDNPELFTRVKRGVYRVKDTKAFAAVAKEWGSSGKAVRVASTNEDSKAPATAPQTSAGDPPNHKTDAETASGSEQTAPAASPSTDTAETEQALSQLGVGQNGITANPFA